MKILVLSNSNLPILKSIISYMGVDVTYDPNDDYDRGVSFMYLKRITKEQLEKPWINFHPAPLPEYKGRNLCYHAIMNGEEEFGATVHYVDENFDTGRIIEVRRFPITPRDTADVVQKMAMFTSQDLLREYLPRYANGEVFESYPNVGGNYYKKMPISEFIEIPELNRQVRAITFGNIYYPKINIGGDVYKIVRSKK